MVTKFNFSLNLKQYRTFSYRIAEQRDIEKRQRLHKSRMTKGNMSIIVRCVDRDNLLDHIQVSMNFLAIDNPLFDIIIGFLTLVSLKGRIDLRKNMVTKLFKKVEVKFFVGSDVSPNSKADVETKID